MCFGLLISFDMISLMLSITLTPIKLHLLICIYNSKFDFFDRVDHNAAKNILG